MPALVTPVHVPAQGRRATAFNGVHDPPLLRRQGRAVPLPIALSILLEDLGHFEARPAHEEYASSDTGQGVERARSFVELR